MDFTGGAPVRGAEPRSGGLCVVWGLARAVRYSRFGSPLPCILKSRVEFSCCVPISPEKTRLVISPLISRHSMNSCTICFADRSFDGGEALEAIQHQNGVWASPIALIECLHGHGCGNNNSPTQCAMVCTRRRQNRPRLILYLPLHTPFSLFCS